jgi:AraC-like DNA-binding protein
MKLQVEIWDVLILLGAFQGLVVSGFLLFSRGKSRSPRANRWVIGLEWVLSWASVGLLIGNTGFGDLHPWLYYIPFLFQMAIGPLFYLYIRSLIFPDRPFARIDWWHFAPVLIDLRYVSVLLLYRVGWVSLPVAKAWFGFPTKHTDALALAAFLAYLWFSYRLLKGQAERTETDHSAIDTKWVRKLLRVFTALAAIWAFYVGLEYSPMHEKWVYWEDYVIYVPLAGVIYWLGIVTYRQPPKAVAGMPVEKPKMAPVNGLKEEEIAQHANSLQRAMQQDRLYLNPQLSVTLLAEHTGIPAKTLSYVLNQHLQKSFNDFVNEYRIEEVKKQMRAPECQHLTIAGMALEAGFNSQATFQRAFKQFTGKSPRQFLSDQPVIR